jgi:hypothetical protein
METSKNSKSWIATQAKDIYGILRIFFRVAGLKLYFNMRCLAGLV